MNNVNKFLPIGSVVLLKQATKKLMIIGYAQNQKREDGTKKLWDYIATLYPEGFLSLEQIFLFDHEQIEKVFYKGYEDVEQKEFMNKVNNIMDNLKK